MSEPAFASPQQAPDETRRALRIRSFIGGEITHSNGSSKTQCTIRDLSETGARIEIPTSITLPDHFDLYVPLKNMREKARVVWRQGAEIGVIFASKEAKPAPAAATAPASEGGEWNSRVRDLEGEVGQLRTQLKLMQALLEQMMINKG